MLCSFEAESNDLVVGLLPVQNCRVEEHRMLQSLLARTKDWRGLESKSCPSSEDHCFPMRASKLTAQVRTTCPVKPPGDAITSAKNKVKNMDQTSEAASPLPLV